MRRSRRRPAAGRDRLRADATAPRSKTLRKRLVELAGRQGYDEAKVRAAVQRQLDKDLDDLTADELRKLVESAADKLNQKRQAQAA